MMDVEPTEASLAAIAEDAEFDWYCCTHFTPLPAMGLAQTPGVISNFPRAFSDHYDDQNYLEHDSITHLLKRKSLLVPWAEAERAYGRGTIQRRMFGEARDVNMQDGISFSYHVGLGQYFGVSVARTSKRLSPLSRAGEYQLLTAVRGWMDGYFDRYDVCAGIELTLKQQRVLDLFIQGKTDEVICWKLGIHASTLKRHIKAIKARLPYSAHNRTEVATQAQQIGLAAKYGLGMQR